MPWTVPDNFRRNECYGCKMAFKHDPRCPKQIYCSHCCSYGKIAHQARQYCTRSTEPLLILGPGFMDRFKPWHESLTQFCRRTGLAKATVSDWNRTGKIPGSNGSVSRFCEAVGMSRQELEAMFSNREEVKG